MWNGLNKGYAEKVFLASGPKVPRTGGIILAQGTKEELENRLFEDPFYKAGAVEYEIIEFMPTMTCPEFEGVKESVP